MIVKGIAARLLAAACACGMFIGTANAQTRRQNTTPKPADVEKMEAALPTEAAVKPEKPRKVLVFGRTGPKTANQGAGFVHSSIPLGCAAVKAMGEKTGAYSAEISYDPSLFDDMSKLGQFDAVVLVSTTHDFLADPNDEAISKKRIDNLVNFVKGGKGVAGFHAAGDAYYDEPEYGELIGAYFSRHDGGREQIQVVNEDPKSPITAAFDGKGFVYHDEIYRFLKQTAAKSGQAFSRSHVHVLLSVDVTKNKNEPAGTDMPVSWIHEEGKGRVFYNSLGHNEYVWYDKTILTYDLAGIQYAIGDLKADATPAGASKTASAK